MKKTFLLSTLIILTTILMLQAGNGDDKDKGKVYGKGVTLTDTVKISELLETPQKYVGKKVLVTGKIVDVCPKRGCWIELASDKKFQTIRIKVKDGEIVFPLSAKGKTAVAEGTLQAIELTKEQAIRYFKHHAEEKGEEFDPNTITGPVTIYQIRGSGAIIK